MRAILETLICANIKCPSYVIDIDWVVSGYDTLSLKTKALVIIKIHMSLSHAYNDESAVASIINYEVFLMKTCLPDTQTTV